MLFAYIDSETLWWITLILASPYLLACLVLCLGYLLLLHLAVRMIEPPFRCINPRSVWFLLIPGFNVFWHLYLTIKLSASSRMQIKDHGVELSQPAYDLHLAVAIFVLNITFLTLLGLGWLLPTPVWDYVAPVGAGFSVCYFIITPVLVIAHLIETLRLNRN